MTDEVPPFLQKQQPIHSAVATELIRLTPKDWKAVQLKVSVDERDDSQSMSHEISSPDGRTELVTPSPELFTLSRQLYLLYKEFGAQPWKQVIYEASLKSEGNWTFSCSFAYP